jgi:hypothetical protein
MARTTPRASVSMVGRTCGERDVGSPRDGGGRGGWDSDGVRKEDVVIGGGM